MPHIIRRHLAVLLAALLGVVIGSVGPGVARAAYDAVNADKVDGKHAVGSSASPSQAAGKLVAHNSQGKLPAKFVAPPSTIRTTHPATAWTPHDSGPSSVLELTAGTTVAGDGGMQIPLAAPQAVYGGTYGLQQVELCYRAVSPGYIDTVVVWGQSASGSEILVSNGTDRTSASFTCTTIPVGKRAPYGASIFIALNGGGTITLHNVRAVWSLATATVAPPPARAISPRLGGAR